MRYLSLFSGIEAATVAWHELGWGPVAFAEIENFPSQVLKHHYPDVLNLGDVTKITESVIKKLGRIDLIVFGSPCQDLSIAGKGKGLNGERSGLFWHYVRLIKETKTTYFLLENVVMKQAWADIISNELGVKPIEINSNLVSAQNRRRLYWTNIPNVKQPTDKGITLGDIIFDDTYKNFTDERITNTKKVTKNYVKWDMSGKQYWSQQDRAYFKEKKVCTLPKVNPANKLNIVLDYENDLYRRMHPIEAERCQNVPDNYTNVDGVNTNRRLEMLGNGWTVDVIAHIFKGLYENL